MMQVFQILFGVLLYPVKENFMSVPNLSHRLPDNAGIAIGPILFVVAILGILAAAIAAGSGSFTSGSNVEKNRSYASSLIQVGQNLKIGFDRIVGLGTVHTAVVIAAANTSTSDDLFSPTGGGIAIPSVALANASTDLWYYPNGALLRFGTNATERVAFLRVAQGVCEQVNNKANALGTSVTNTAVDIGDPTNEAASLAGVANWPADLRGRPTGCINNDTTGTAADGYWFYQVLGIQ
jgi:type II secretory pathway pseudopilin PulG